MSERRHWLENRIPPPLVMLLVAVAMWAVAGGLPPLPEPGAPRIALAAAMAFAAAFFLLAGVVSFRLAKTTVNPLKPATASALVTAGIYRITRNPMYVGFTLLLIAWACLLASLVALPGALAYALYIDRFQVAPEERALRGLFGSEFDDYCARVRRWL